MIRLRRLGHAVILDKGEVSCSDEFARIHAESALGWVQSQTDLGPADGDPDYYWADMLTEYGYEIEAVHLDPMPEGVLI